MTNPADTLDKQIEHLQAILFWTESQANVLKAGIAALQAQKQGVQIAQTLWEPYMKLWFPQSKE